MTDMRGFLTDARAKAESLMTDRCTVWRTTGAQDETTGLPVREKIWEGPVKVFTYGGNAWMSTVEASNISFGTRLEQWYIQLHFPYSCNGLQVSDIVKITNAIDPVLVGRQYRLMNLLSEKSHSTSHRWNVTEMQKGGGNEN